MCNFLQVRETNVRVLGFRIGQNLKRGHRGQLSNSSLDLAVWIYGFLDQGKSALPEVSTRSPFNPGNFWYKQDMCSE